MTRRFAVVAVMSVVLLAVSFSTGCRNKGPSMSHAKPKAPPVQVGATEFVPIVKQVSLNEPAIARPGVVLIQSEEQLKALNATELATVEIDFATQSLVVLSLGEQPTGGYWCRITGMQAGEGILYVQGLANRPGPDDMVTQALTYPAAAAVIAKTDATATRLEIESVLGRATN